MGSSSETFVFRNLRHTVTTAYAALSTSSLIFTGEISCPPANAAVVTFKDSAGNEAPWDAGEWHPVKSIDLNTIQVKGMSGDFVVMEGSVG